MNKWMVAVVAAALVGGASSVIADPDPQLQMNEDGFAAKISIRPNCAHELQDRVFYGATGQEVSENVTGEDVSIGQRDCDKRLGKYDLVFGGGATFVVGAERNGTDVLQFVVEAYEDRPTIQFQPTNFDNCKFYVQMSDGSSYSPSSMQIVKVLNCSDADEYGSKDVYHNPVCDGNFSQGGGCNYGQRERGTYVFQLSLKDFMVDAAAPLGRDPVNGPASGVQGNVMDVFFCPGASDLGIKYGCVHYFSPRSKTHEDRYDDNPECGLHPSLAGFEHLGVGQCGTISFPFNRYVADQYDDDTLATTGMDEECSTVRSSPYLAAYTANTVIDDGDGNPGTGIGNAVLPAAAVTDQCPETVYSPAFTPIVIVERGFQGGTTDPVDGGGY